MIPSFKNENLFFKSELSSRSENTDLSLEIMLSPLPHEEQNTFTTPNAGTGVMFLFLDAKFINAFQMY